MDFFARIWEQAKDLWSRPYGKLLLGGVASVLIVASSFALLSSRPKFVPLGSFAAEDANQVVKKLQENKIQVEKSGSGSSFAFQVPEADLQTARLVLAELTLDPNGSAWSPDLWKNRVSWSDTEFDKRQQKIEQAESNLARSIMALNVVDRARVTITVPMEKPLFKSDEKPPKATVYILPKKGQSLTNPVVEGIMESVAASVEGLARDNVIVMDASTSRVVSADAFKQKTPQQASDQMAVDQLTILQRYQEHFELQLTKQLERMLGTGNVSVIVTPIFNWQRVEEEALHYKGAAPDGKGIVLSTQTTKESGEGTPAPANGSTGPSGTTPNAEGGPPTYPSAGQTGTTTMEKNSTIINYLVDQTKTKSEKPGGIEEINVGVFVNETKLTNADMEKKINEVVTVAMGSKARVQVAAAPFDTSLRDIFDKSLPPTVATASLNWLAIIMGVALGLGCIALFFLAVKPKRPVLEPVFAGPEAAMMGGIPVSELEMAVANQAYAAHGAPMDPFEAGNRLPETAEDLAQMAPEEIALLGDDFLKKIGVDPTKVRMKEKVEKIAKASPESVANLLKTWIVDE